MRVPLELQSGRAECGLACLAMVAGAYDSGINLLVLRSRFGASGQGATFKDLVRQADALNFVSRGLRCELRDLTRLRAPAILHWRMDHFVVLVRIARRGCVLHDPAHGRRFCSWREMDSSFTGAALEIWPAMDFVPAANSPPRLTLGELYGALQDSRSWLWWTVLLAALVQFMVLAASWHVQWTVDLGVSGGDASIIEVLAWGFALLLGLRVLTQWLRGVLVMHAGHGLSLELGCDLLRQLLALPPGWFEDRRAGDIVSRFDALPPVQDFFTRGVGSIVVDGMMVLLAAFFMLFYEPLLALGVITLHVVTALLQAGMAPRMQRLQTAAVAAAAEERSHLVETVHAIHTVKAYGQEPVRHAQWQRLHSQTLGHRLSLQQTQLGLHSVVTSLGGIEHLVTVAFLAHAVLNGSLTLGMLFAFLSYRSHFAERARLLSEEIVSLRLLKVYLARLADIWLSPAEPQGIAPGSRCPAETLRACQMQYRHASHSSWVLDGVDLTVEPGEFVAVVGASGCGKTTLLRLLMGFDHPDAGRVLWGERELAGEALGQFRRQSACVMQGDSLFSGSIADNITLWATPDEARLLACLDAVGLKEVIEALPMQVRTRLGEIGSSFSAGQMQRLMLARALYRQPDYLFVDEGTAHLDRAGSLELADLLRAVACTRVVVTHDLTLAAHADRVWHVARGKVVEIMPSEVEQLRMQAD